MFGAILGEIQTCRPRTRTFSDAFKQLWVIIHVFCLFATKQRLGQHFWVVLRLSQVFQKTPFKVTLSFYFQ